jgi:hypothetical protein
VNPDSEIVYAVTEDFGLPVYLHEFIWVGTHGPLPSGKQVSHKNGDVLDNQNHNLTLVDCPIGEEYMGDSATTILAAYARN